MSDEIREITSSDIERISDIWLEASLIAHHFVPAEFWRKDYQVMKGELLPRATGYVHVAEGEVDGFITVAGGFIDCLFVDPRRQRKGIGSALLGHVQALHDSLELAVYEQNPEACRFYERHGFKPGGVSKCQYTGAPEVRMTWSRSRPALG